MTRASPAPADGAPRGETVARATALGCTADAALASSGDLAHVVATLRESIYLEASGELLWFGWSERALHPRAIVAGAPLSDLPAPGLPLRVDRRGAATWRPEAPAVRVAPAVLRGRARALAVAVTEGGAGDGFGALLAGRRPAFPLDRVDGAAHAFARACAAGDAGAAERAAADLIGCGPGLTPAGDDYVGGALFARAVALAPGSIPAGADTAAAWRAAVERILATAAARTHRVSAVLLRDLAAGRGWRPLHDLVAALAAGGRLAAARQAAEGLTRIGHSSGWDWLAGVLGVLAAPGAPARAAPPPVE